MPRLRAPPWVNSSGGISCTRAPEPPRPLDAPVLRARVDDDDLDLVVDLLARDRLQAAHEVEPAVLDGDDDGDHAGAAATTNWYAKSGGRTRPTAWATRSTAGEPTSGTGTV